MALTGPIMPLITHWALAVVTLTLTLTNTLKWVQVKLGQVRHLTLSDGDDY